MTYQYLLNECQQQLLNRLLRDRAFYRLSGFRFVTIEYCDSSKEYKVFLNRELPGFIADNIKEVCVL